MLRSTNKTEISNLHERYEYNPKTGELYSKRSKRVVGAKHGTKRRYLCVWVDGKRIMVHRIAWAMTYGYWPGILDHINRDGNDNRIENLREVSPLQNGRNLSLSKNNNTGVSGVCLCKQTGRYKATINARGKQHWLGRFDTIEEAAKARKDAQKEIWGE